MFLFPMLMKSYVAAGVSGNGYFFGSNLLKMPFATEAYSNVGAFLTWTDHDIQDKGISDKVNGYGYRLGNGPAGGRVKVDRINFSADTAANVGDNSYYGGAAANSATSGYSIGVGAYQTPTQIVGKTSLSSYGWSSLGNKLVASVAGLTTAQTANEVYTFGSYSNRNNIEKFPFSTETGSYIAATTTYGSFGSAVFSSTAAYYTEDGPVSGDYGIDRLIFSTEAKSQIFTTFGMNSVSTFMSSVAGYWAEGTAAGTFPLGSTSNANTKFLFSTETPSSYVASYDGLGGGTYVNGTPGFSN